MVQKELPIPPAESIWNEELGGPPEAVASLCKCVDALAAETMRRLHEAEGRLGVQSSPNDRLDLRAERISLAQELERLTAFDPHALSRPDPSKTASFGSRV